MPDEHPLKQHAQTALYVQNACNLSGVVYSFARAMSTMCEMGLDTDARNRHPISILFADKIISLTGTQNAALTEYDRAYQKCEKLADGKA